MLKINDLVTLKEAYNKNEPRYTYRIDKIDFKKRLIFAFRESDIDVDVPEGKWLSFNLIHKVFPQTINSCLCNFGEFDHFYTFSPNWDQFIAKVASVRDFTVTSTIPESHQFQPILAKLQYKIPKHSTNLPVAAVFEFEND